MHEISNDQIEYKNKAVTQVKRPLLFYGFVWLIYVLMIIFDSNLQYVSTIIIVFITPIICSLLAQAKNRSEVGWFSLGFISSVLALFLALYFSASSFSIGYILLSIIPVIIISLLSPVFLTKEEFEKREIKKKINITFGFKKLSPKIKLIVILIFISYLVAIFILG